jgi:hypothetical protein
VRGDPKVEAIAGQLGLPNGRLISWSKSGYRDLYPHNFVLFNGSIADDAGKLLGGVTSTSPVMRPSSSSSRGRSGNGSTWSSSQTPALTTRSRSRLPLPSSRPMAPSGWRTGGGWSAMPPVASFGQALRSRRMIGRRTSPTQAIDDRTGEATSTKSARTGSFLPESGCTGGFLFSVAARRLNRVAELPAIPRRQRGI